MGPELLFKFKLVSKEIFDPSYGFTQESLMIHRLSINGPCIYGRRVPNNKAETPD